MAVTALAINSPDETTPEYAAAAYRTATGVLLMYDGSAVAGRQGVRPGGTQLRVTVTTMTISVAAGCAVVTPGQSANQGSYLVASDAVTTLTVDPRDGTLERKDIVYVGVEDADYAGSERRAVVAYLAGDPGDPTAPDVPAGGLLLATITVPSAAVGTALTVVDGRVYTAAAGGVVSVTNQAEREALSGYDSLMVWQRDVRRLYVWGAVASNWGVVSVSQPRKSTSGFSLAPGWDEGRDDPWIARDRNGSISFTLEVKRTGATLSSTDGNIPDTLLGTAPSGWRPPEDISCSASTGAAMGEVRFDAGTGQLTLRCLQGTINTSSPNLRVSGAFNLEI